MTDKAAGPDGSALSEGLGPLMEDAASECLSELAGVDTYDVNLRDHPKAWAAIEAFADKVLAAERKRLATEFTKRAEALNTTGAGCAPHIQAQYEAMAGELLDWAAVLG